MCVIMIYNVHYHFILAMHNQPWKSKFLSGDHF